MTIEYLFKGELHRAEVGDTQPVVAPLRGESCLLFAFLVFTSSRESGIRIFFVDPCTRLGARRAEEGKGA